MSLATCLLIFWIMLSKLAILGWTLAESLGYRPRQTIFWQDFPLISGTLLLAIYVGISAF